MSTDIYYSKEYAQLYAEEGEIICFTLDNEYGSINDVFIKRKIINGWYDLSTPYGYGGAVITKCIDRKKLLESFEERMAEFCRKNNIVSQFVRFHPLLDNQNDFGQMYQAKMVAHTVSVNLLKENLLMEEISGKTRNQIRKAMKNKIEIVFDFDCDRMEEFINIYYKTMDKNNASTYYYFSHEFFYRMKEELKKNLIIVEAFYNGKMIAASMILLGKRYMHYHLSGSNEESRSLYPTNLILYQTMEWGKKNGYEEFHLGGGYGGDDSSLFKFKKGFSKSEEKKFYIGKKIWNREIYEKLCTGRGINPYEVSFFPAYRVERGNRE